MRLDQTRARSARWPTSILLLKPDLLKRQVGELVNVYVCMNVANGNSSQLIPSIGTAARNVTSPPGVGSYAKPIRHIAGVNRGGFAVANSHKPIANVESSGPSQRNRRLPRHQAPHRWSLARAIRKRRPMKNLVAIVRAATDDSLRQLNHRCRNSVVFVAATLYDESFCANASGSSD